MINIYKALMPVPSWRREREGGMAMKNGKTPLKNAKRGGLAGPEYACIL